MSDTLLETEDAPILDHDAREECSDLACPCHEWVRQQSTKEVTEHQPAARGGGDEVQRIRQRVKVGLCAIDERSDDPYNLSTRLGDTEYLLDQHQALVAARERWERDRKFLGDRLEAQVETMANIVKERNQLRLALEIIRDSFWSENEPFEERVEFLQQTAKDILITIHEQRSTSE